MSDSQPTSNVKVYDRPERKAPTPVVMLLALLIVLVLGFLVYKVAFRSDSTPAPQTGTGTARPGRQASP